MQAEINLDPEGRASRLRSAVIMLALAMTLVIVLAELAASAPWWVVVGPPLFLTSSLVVQAYTGVCPGHAARGTRATCHGTERVLDPAKQSCLADRGRSVMGVSIAIALASTALVVALASVR